MGELPQDIAVYFLGGIVLILALVFAVRALWYARRAEEARAALARSRAELADAQRIGNMGSWVWDVSTNDLTWSDQIYRIFGLKPQQFVPTYPAFVERIHPDDRAEVEEAVRKAVLERKPYEINHRVVRPDGSERVVCERGEVTFAPDGRPLKMLGSCQDVTDLVRLREESDEQRRKLRGVLDNMFVFVASFSKDGVMLDTNRAALEVLGRRRDEVVGRKLWDTYFWSHSPETQARARAAIARAAEGGVVREDFVIRIDERRFMTIDTTFGPLTDRDGRVVQVIGSAVDVTARKQAEDAVRASEARLRTILDSEPECVKVVDADCRLLSLNAAGLRMIGAKSAEDVCGRSVLELIDPKYRDAFAEGVAKVFAGETTLQQFEIVSQEGVRRWVEQHAAPLFEPDDPGRVREMIAVTRDVTERVEMERASSRMREQLEQAQRIANIGSWSWDFRTGELAWSDQCYRIVGWEPDGAKPSFERFFACVHPDDRAKLEATVRNGLEEGAPCDYDHRVVWPNGEIRVVHQIGEVERDANGKPVRMIGTTQDVTELRAIETELRQSRGTLTGILTISPEGVVVSDAEGRITLFSAGAEAIFGHKAEDVLGKSIDCLMPERFRAAHRGHLRSFGAGPEASRRMGQRAEIVALRKDGEEFPAQASLSKLETPQGVVFTVILRDVGQEKAAQAELLAAKVKAESASQAKSRFVASMSHELRTPLNAIIGFSELLMSDEGANLDPDKRAEYAADINRSGKHLLSVINDILDVSRIEAGKVTLDEDTVAVGELIHTVHRMLKVRADETGVSISWKADAEAPAVIADRRLLLQTLLNLTSNAVKFTDAGGRVDIAVRRAPDGGVDIAVKDTGIGMSPADVARVGEPFLQIDGRLARNFEGTGLGLVIAKRLVEMHGGELVIESALGAGTTMTVRLPASRNAPAKANRPAVA